MTQTTTKNEIEKTETTINETKLCFGGFYDSIHSNIIEDYIDGLKDDEETEDFDRYSQNDSKIYDELKENYISEYMELFNTNLGTELKFIKLESPKSYNYTTDKMIVSYSKSDLKKMFEYLRDNDAKDDLHFELKRVTTPYSGYMPYFTFKEILKKENKDKFVEILLSTIIDRETDGGFLSTENLYSIELY
jgi:hypothetical protein